MDTISALATALVESGIGIIRLSGEDALSIAEKILRTKSGKPLDIRESHRIRYGFVYDKEEAVDEVLVSTFLAPKSYTGEDVVEINCHGGVLLMQKIFTLTLKHGARAAEPGEFTKRAFLNGRIDLSQAEAVADLIASKTEAGIQSSLALVQGALGEKIKECRSLILEDTAFIEAALDDPEHISLDGFSEKCAQHTEYILQEIEKLLRFREEGRMLTEGIHTAIVGKPNAGKSSLLNALVGAEKAIVTDIPGTTRDMVEENIRLDGLSLHLMDTAGIRNTEDIVEGIGVEKAKKSIEHADLILFVVDALKEFEKEDEEILSLVQGKKTIVLLNKTDQETVLTKKELEEKTGLPVIEISAKQWTGIKELGEKIRELFFSGSLSFSSELFVHSERQRVDLEEAKRALLEVKNGLSLSLSEDFLSIDLMGAYIALGRILGEEVSEDLVNEIFAKFCMGK